MAAVAVHNENNIFARDRAYMWEEHLGPPLLKHAHVGPGVLLAEVLDRGFSDLETAIRFLGCSYEGKWHLAPGGIRTYIVGGYAIFRGHTFYSPQCLPVFARRKICPLEQELEEQLHFVHVVYTLWLVLRDHAADTLEAVGDFFVVDTARLSVKCQGMRLLWLMNCFTHASDALNWL